MEISVISVNSYSTTTTMLNIMITHTPYYHTLLLTLLVTVTYTSMLNIMITHNYDITPYYLQHALYIYTCYNFRQRKCKPHAIPYMYNAVPSFAYSIWYSAYTCNMHTQSESSKLQGYHPRHCLTHYTCM